MPDIGAQLSELENMGLSDEEKQAKKDTLMQDYAIKAERVHTVNQLLKAYALFERDDEYVVIDNKVKIVDEQTGRITSGYRSERACQSRGCDTDFCNDYFTELFPYVS